MIWLTLFGFAGPATSTFVAVAPTNQRDWLTEDNYPTRAAGLDKSGVTQADIFVDANGAPQNCTVTLSSGSTDLDGQSCAAAIKRGRFTPARDEAGQAMPGVYRFRTQWRLPAEKRFRTPADVTLSVSSLPPGRSALMVYLRYIVDEEGRISRCAVEVGSGFPKFDAAACAAMPARYRFAPARDNAGRAWRVVRTQSVAFELAQPAG